MAMGASGYRKIFTSMSLLLTGCASGTGVLPAGPDTYTLVEHVPVLLGGAESAETTALQKANEFCVAKNRVFVANSMGNTGTGHYSVTFRCLPANDPAVATYHLA